MNYSVELKKALIKKLTKSCTEQLEFLKKDLENQSIFSFAIYCSNGCSHINVAACSREGLDLHKANLGTLNEPAWYGEVNGAEWSYYSNNFELFDEVNTFIEELFDIFYDGELDDGERDEYDDDELWEFISDFFIDVTVQVLKNLRSNGCFNEKCFEDDLLLGMQFGDPDKHAVDMIEKSSEQLNSVSWHEKIKISCNSMRKMFNTE
ncbi:DUF4303 domain-containing protein [Motilimonas pumila]|uniref:DUF4303 domain-containing protein n=1 Tax=Motilimonas pumila TaxID=2303987 RepID=A0A418Y994_9GAMM|nr:DUF4303 domain-containing protein [Motilimonas pumila]RJG36792.1 DUF4303 domain-containing protein [Motilimonas pumila]